MGDNPFISYDCLRLELHKVDIEVCRQTAISSLKRMEHGSYFAAHKPVLTDEHMKKKPLWAHKHVHWADEE